MTSKEIRTQFIDFFKAKDHSFVRSAPVVPIDDPTLLFTNAGMNQFKPIFLNTDTPKTKRAVNTQKCIRVSGKHNDLEEVGVDNFHHTFFEMLGNWSFGDYYKKEAIRWAWELLTDVWKIDKTRLWVTIFQDDDEAGELWKNETDIDPIRILKFGHKDNFWEMGETGPCGPCSEIHFYAGDDLAAQSAAGVNVDPDYREIWNLVFIQYNRSADGTLHDLPQKHVDTGAGFERIVALLNGVKSNYDTDLFVPIINRIVELTGKSSDFQNGIPHQVIADHLRMLSFSIADGVMPSNDGRGYVLRRVLRRAARFGRILDKHEPFIYKLVDTLNLIMGAAFPELPEKLDHIKNVIRAEESSFGETLDRGIEIFEKISADLKSGEIISGEDAFKLYDTFGFPLDLTELMAREKGITVNTDQFGKCMAEQKKRARSAGKFKLESNDLIWNEISTGNSSDFIGYDLPDNDQWQKAQIRKYRFAENHIEIILDKTPFYGEKGGQIGDTGTIRFSFPDKVKISTKIYDTQWIGEDTVHLVQFDKAGDLLIKDLAGNIQFVEVKVDNRRRKNIKLNHTATHLFHKALKIVLGDHVNQAGSLVASERFRFDVTHYEKIKPEQLREIEDIVNTKIRDNLPINTSVKDFDVARSEGAVALFGEKYGDEVRVVDIPEFSKELCGGTHVRRTGDIGAFKIISESALAAGVRRIEAITGAAVFDLLAQQEKILLESRNLLKCSEPDLPQRISILLSESKDLEKENRTLKSKTQGNIVDDLIYNTSDDSHIKLIVTKIDNSGDLRELGDEFRQKFKKEGIALIGTVLNDKPMVMCAVTDDLTSKVNAGKIVREVGLKMGGGGGGKPHLATAGGKKTDQLEDALEHGKKLIISMIS